MASTVAIIGGAVTTIVPAVVAAIAKQRKEELEYRKWQDILNHPNAEERQRLLGIKREEAKGFSCLDFIYNALLIYLAIFFPPFCVLIVKGCSMTLLYNLIFTCFFYIPGIIHAFFILYKSNKKPPPQEPV